LVEGILPIGRSFKMISVAPKISYVRLYSLQVLRLDAIPTVALIPASVILR